MKFAPSLLATHTLNWTNIISAFLATHTLVRNGADLSNMQQAIWVHGHLLITVDNTQP